MSINEKEMEKLQKAFPDVDLSDIQELRRLETECELSENRMCGLIRQLLDLLHSDNGHVERERQAIK